MIVSPAAVIAALDPEPDSVMPFYIAAFAPRTDLYVVNSAEVVREPITPEVLTKALRYKYPISAYMATEDGRTHLGAIDFDTENGMEQAVTVSRILVQFDIKPLIFESRRGAHLWVMLYTDPENKTPKVSIVRRALRQAIGLAGFDPDDPKIEVFPKRGTDLAVGALRIPGLHHHKTQVRYPGYTWEGEKVEGFVSILSAFDCATYDALAKLAGPDTRATTYPKRQGGDSFYFLRPRERTDAPSASQVLIDWGAINAKPGGTVRCPAHQDRRRSLTIFKDDQRVYCGSPVCVLHGDGHGVGSIALAKMVPA